MRQAYIDESGYTGRDLLNAQQPFLVLSALFITVDEARTLRDKHFPKLRAPELKHGPMARRPNHWQALLGLQRECLEKYCGISYVADKRYLCILKLLDDCIEPVWHTEGIDFYERGHNYALASVLYVTGPTFFGQQNFDQLLRLYQNASATKRTVEINALCDHAVLLRDRELGDVLAPIADRHPAFLNEIAHPATSTNPAFSLLSGLISQLEPRANEAYSIVHDPSPAMREYHEVLKALQQSEPASFRISDVAQISYPLKLREIAEADSKVAIGLQLADVLAGGLADASRVLSQHTAPNDYNTKVLDLYSDDNLMFLVPNKDPQEIQAAFKDSEAGQMIEYLARAAARNR